MDRVVIDQKLESLRRCVARVMAKRPDSVAALAERLRRAVGFRNLAVHNYDTIDWALVFAISGDQLDDFRAFAKSFA